MSIISYIIFLYFKNKSTNFENIFVGNISKLIIFLHQKPTKNIYPVVKYKVLVFSFIKIIEKNTALKESVRILQAAHGGSFAALNASLLLLFKVLWEWQTKNPEIPIKIYSHSISEIKIKI